MGLALKLELESAVFHICMSVDTEVLSYLDI